MLYGAEYREDTYCESYRACTRRPYSEVLLGKCVLYILSDCKNGEAIRYIRDLEEQTIEMIHIVRATDHVSYPVEIQKWI